MKILQILPALDVGGVERGVIDLARGMKQRGHETVVISSGGPLVAELKKIGVPHYELPVHKKSLFSLFLIPKIQKIIEKERVDVVHARSRVPAWLAWFAARRAGVPFMTTCHGYYSEHFLSRIMGWGKRVIVISNVIGRHMIDHFGVAPETIRLIHRGVDLSQFVSRESVAGELGRDGAAADESVPVFKIINIGRFSPIKGQIEFLRAVHILHREMPRIEVWLVGSEGKGRRKYTHTIQQTVRQLGLESCVKLLGTRRDIPELLRQSDLLVLSTLVPEAFGRVLIEAGAVGTPVLSTRVGGVVDIIDDGEDGVLVAPGDVEGMAAAMRDMLADRDRARLLASRLRAKIAERFSLERMVEKNLEVYSEVRKHKKILVIKLGAMGDLILIVPSLRMLRERFPEAEISLLVDRKLAGLVSTCPYLNEVIPVDRERLSNLAFLFKLAKKIRTEGYDLSVDFQNSKWTHLLAFIAGISERYGFSRGRFGFLLNRPDHTYEVSDSPVKHQCRILKKLGVRSMREELELWPERDAEIKMEEIFFADTGDSGRKAVGLVVGSSPKWPTKRWPAGSFRMLAERLIHECGCRIVLIGSRHDAELGKHFEGFPAGDVLNMLGETSYQELVSLFKRLDVVVTGDTAPLHVAAAMKTKIVGLFGPTDPKRHMPPAEGAVVLQRGLSCSPCYSGTCRMEDPLLCLTQISVDEVFEAVRRQLEECRVP
jgi:lipopolysaccharide heptosyltransferase II